MPVFLMIFRRFAPFASFGGGFEGDNRIATADPAASSRTSGSVMFDETRAQPLSGASSGTAYVGPFEVMKDIGPRFLGRHFAKVSLKLSNFRSAGNGIQFTAYTEGGNPMVPGAPDIDTFVDLVAHFGPDRVNFTGDLRGDGFPNAEVIFVDPTGKAHLVLDYRTSSGITGPMTRLMGNGDTNKFARFSVTFLQTDRGYTPILGTPLIKQEA
jgi:hypothetical protein